MLEISLSFFWSHSLLNYDCMSPGDPVHQLGNTPQSNIVYCYQNVLNSNCLTDDTWSVSWGSLLLSCHDLSILMDGAERRTSKEPLHTRAMSPGQFCRQMIAAILIVSLILYDFHSVYGTDNNPFFPASCILIILRYKEHIRRR